MYSVTAGVPHSTTVSSLHWKYWLPLLDHLPLTCVLSLWVNTCPCHLVYTVC
ncbi:hypothetical protein I79_007086 [Cricetulus griseus]|uniref:Uncharacterized protein n=1 Tax=Cricetulus griseus TaxID=10029 RepID=G3H9L0_CRIGR|nr:hypothetical protein I79_007086 [Cricetulus griseus]